jgi:hypothetical protein
MRDENSVTPPPSDDAASEMQIGGSYPLLQMAKALVTSEEDADPATRARAVARVAKWQQVFQGMVAGKLRVGSRTPLADVPTWATLEVVTGGFATGNLLAGGPLLPHEEELVAAQPALAGETGGRTLLNAYYLTEAGLALLRDQLRTGHYEIDVPEEGALLVVAWLIERGYGDEARALLEELGPFFDRLRFYPRPVDRPMHNGAQVFLESVGSTIAALSAIDTSPQILAQREAIEIWSPLYDEMVRLLLATVVGDAPTLRLDGEGKSVLGEYGWPQVDGGWPCSTYPDGWAQRTRQVLEKYAELRLTHTLTSKPTQAASNFAQIRMALQDCLDAPLRLTLRQVRWMRLVLARYITKRGTPDSSRHRELRRQQARQIDIPIYKEIAQTVIVRLAAYDKDGGIADLERVTQPISPQESEALGVRAGVAVPMLIANKVERAVIDSVAGLIARGVITSGDTLARVLPQITSEIRAAGIVDSTLRPLYAAIYRAFRRRRSLLLLNYESQVRIEELPWVAAIDRFRQENLSTRDLARETLEETVVLALTSFPEAILPNKLLQEFQTLAKGAELEIPFVDEVAADIFMGDFSAKFTEAAKLAARTLEGTLYARYYGIDTAEILRLPDGHTPRGFQWQIDTSAKTLVAICARRAAVSNDKWGVARNGTIIEQQQILTTQNLAPLFAALDLGTRLQGQLGEMARACFVWICQRQQMKIDEWHGRLIMVKNTAYAWRQMIFFLAFLPPAEVAAFLGWAAAHLQEQNVEFQARFRPAMEGLAVAARGRSFDTLGVDRRAVRQFLGWTTGKHWLLEEKELE